MTIGNDTHPAVGAVVVDAAGIEIGSLTGTAVDPSSLHIAWLVIDVAAGAADAVAALPAYVASVRGDGRVVVPFARDLVLQAPPLVGDVVSRDLADRLYAYYALT